MARDQTRDPPAHDAREVPVSSRSCTIPATDLGVNTVFAGRMASVLTARCCPWGLKIATDNMEVSVAELMQNLIYKNR